MKRKKKKKTISLCIRKLLVGIMHIFVSYVHCIYFVTSKKKNNTRPLTKYENAIKKQY